MATSKPSSKPGPACPGAGDVHIWVTPLDDLMPHLDAMRELLAADESHRADRFHFDLDRQRFIVRRGILRQVLSHYLTIPPRDIRYDLGPHGKPAIAAPRVTNPLQFNTSHARGIAVCAVTAGQAVGVDIEALDPSRADRHVAEQQFAPRELSQLNTLIGEQWTAGFFNCWTRKEAYIKAIGEGLSRPLNSFSVSLLPGEPAALCSCDADPHEPDRWSFNTLDCGPGFAGCVVVNAQINQVIYRNWREP